MHDPLMDPSTLDARFNAVQLRIAAAVSAAKRDPATVTLVAVSKTHPAASISALRSLGHCDFGENYVQEWTDKQAVFAHDTALRWHLIGHLQSNKAKLVAAHAAMVHSVDSSKIAQSLDRHASVRPSRLSVLVQVNVGDETQKSGCEPSELGDILDAVDRCKHLALSGLMTIPPVTENPAESLRFFELLASLQRKHGGDRRLPHLSMGMTHDLEYAIQSGATIVRVGTAIFGARG